LKGAPTPERWAAVGRAVSRRMDQLRVSKAELARRVRSSETTVRDIARGIGQHNESMLVAISAVLDWPTDYLVNILDGKADEHVPPESRLEKLLASEFAEVGALRESVAGLKESVDVMSKKIDVLIEDRHPSGADPQPESGVTGVTGEQASL
jgi:transcriptional regulator with XRE-family HTH domain